MPLKTKSQSLVKKYGDHLFFWSPSVRWIKSDSEVRIEMYSYSDIAVDIFPEFYYISQKGVQLEEILNSFSDVDPVKLNWFITDLIENRILIYSLMSPQELYYSQANLFRNPYDQDTFIDPEKYTNFINAQLTRSFENVTDFSIQLDEVSYPDVISNRKSYRTFDTQKMPLETVSKLFSVFRQYRNNESIRYNYATAGGLYPVDLFVYIKDHRVDNMKAGLYYYNPISNALQLVSNSCVITEEIHYSINKDIFKSSAISLYFVYNGNVSMPKYGGLGYFYSSIDTGIMVQLLTQVAEMNNVGLCSIGEINFGKVKKYFKLTTNHVLIHTVEIGLKPTI